MAFHSTRAAADALSQRGQLVRITQEIDPNLEAAEIQRRVYAAGGPAVLFERVKGSRFPMLSNMFGTRARAEILFADSLERVRRIVELKVDPANALRRPFRYLGVPFTALTMLPRHVSSGPALEGQCRLSELPQVKSWPNDGGAFITLPQVYSEDPSQPGNLMKSNLGMYRVQLSGNDYEVDREVGLHYQIHRGIGVHHQEALRRGEPLRVSIFVGGPPAMTLSAVMPLPEGLSELSFAGALARKRVRLARVDGHVVHTDADFCIVGTIAPAEKPEGPFGDHLGYYSLQHSFPVLRVERVYHRPDAIWPFTVVGRPPQEDTVFGELIHELTGPVIPTVLPGVRAVHAVDASGVHPLLLALGSERYVPYRPRKEPQELLTQANAMLGQGQMSLAKYLLLCAGEDDPALDIHDIAAFLRHLLVRVDFRRDLHFQTRTTIDTLDYSGHGLNQGSKLVMAAAGEPIRTLTGSLPEISLPDGFSEPRVCMPGVLAVRARAGLGAEALRTFCAHFQPDHAINAFPWIVLVDDSEFAARNLDNFLWVTFTRSNPAVDLDGIGAFTEHKHWGCMGSLVFDARVKPHHAPPLVEDPAITRRVDALAAPGGPLHGII